MCPEDAISQIREFFGENFTAESVLPDRPILHEVKTMPSPGGEIILSMFRT
jgi:hypothetical protein